MYKNGLMMSKVETFMCTCERYGMKEIWEVQIAMLDGEDESYYGRAVCEDHGFKLEWENLKTRDRANAVRIMGHRVDNGVL